MKSIVACILIAATVCYAQDAVQGVQGDKYTSKYDDFNLEAVLSSDRLLRTYISCLKGTGGCTAEGLELKRILPDALETSCSKCNEKQKYMARRMIGFVMNEKPKYWAQLKTVYDPTGEYTIRYQKYLKELKHSETQKYNQ